MATAMTMHMPSSRTRPKPPARVNTSTTYTLAHTAQCKLRLAAKRTDRDLRFILGHAFTLDNLMLRIVEIENRQAKSAFAEGVGKKSREVSDAEDHFDCSLANTKTATAPSTKEHHDDGDFDCSLGNPDTAATTKEKHEDSDFDCSLAHPDTAPTTQEQHDDGDFDCSLAHPDTAATAKGQHDGDHDDDGEFDCTKAPPPEHDDDHKVSQRSSALGGGGDEASAPAGGRRISFQDNNARPSKNGYGYGHESGGSRSPRKGRRSPSPQPQHLVFPAGLSDDSDDGTSSDDYEDPELMAYDCEAAPPVPEEKKAIKRAKQAGSKKARDAYVDEEDAALELADDELDTNNNTDVDEDADSRLADNVKGARFGLGDDGEYDDDGDDDDDGMPGLTRFQSASARPPRMIEDVEGDDDDDDDDHIGPDSPPQLPADVDVREIIAGERDEELTDLYEKVRRCACHGNRDNVGGKAEGIWDVPVEKTGGKVLAVVAVAA
ncbi:hypothetical protein PV08_05347 [Exophiala spinifera]|uniref:Uncharacterized protein n=1 Tax=Exophiala spinifera TaxID=91928 RepID=A0A0D1ZR65_9EURO|nr:uncharacterized protein PV08_05347 [Exophiala spinifera]KIW15302.1 hypothetical protein PV08_05347 [Exophiala spinifera]